MFVLNYYKDNLNKIFRQHYYSIIIKRARYIIKYPTKIINAKKMF